MLSSALAVAAALLFQAAPASAPGAPASPPAAAPATTAAAPAAPAPAPAKKPKLVCKSEAVIGSLMPKKTCYSEDTAKERQQEERQNLERLQQLSH